MSRKLYRVVHIPSRTNEHFYADSAEDAIEKSRWPREECMIMRFSDSGPVVRLEGLINVEKAGYE